MKKVALAVLFILALQSPRAQVPPPDSVNVLIPASFSPNGDGKEDLFFVRPGRALVTCEVFIFDKWGNMLAYFTTAAVGWNGTYKSGRVMADDVYICSVSAYDAAHRKYRYKANFKLER